MPIYEFECDCGLRFENYYAKTSEEQTEICPACGKAAQRVMSAPNFTFAEPTSIPKEIDHKVGKDAEKRWEAYETRKNIKEKVRTETGTPKLSRDEQGNYTPLTVVKDEKIVSESEGVAIRKELYNRFDKVRKDPNTIKEEIKDNS